MLNNTRCTCICTMACHAPYFISNLELFQIDLMLLLDNSISCCVRLCRNSWISHIDVYTWEMKLKAHRVVQGQTQHELIKKSELHRLPAMSVTC